MRGLYITFTPQYIRPIVITYEPETEAFLNAISISNDSTTYFGSTAYEILGSEIWTALDGCVVQIKTALGLTLGVNNLSTKFKYIYPRIGGTSTKHAYNLVTATATGTFSGGWTHDGSGATPNGTNAYMNTGYTYTASNFTVNNNTFGAVIKDNSEGAYCEFGVSNFGYTDIFFFPRFSGNLFLTRLNDQTNNSTSNSTSLGHFAVSRTASTSYKQYKDGTALATITQNSTPFNIANGLIYEACTNNNGSPLFYSPHKRTWLWGGLGFNDTEISDIHSALATFETALNR